MTRDIIARSLIAKHAAARIAVLCRRTKVCVQAGGHIGLWPRELARLFRRVYTFEPNRENFAALQRTASAHNVTAVQAALGATPGTVALRNTTGKSGMWFTVPGDEVRVTTVDDLKLTAFDALVLDVEGDELPALEGAERSIRQHRPLIWFEGHLRNDGRTERVIAWLLDRGYDEPRKGFGRDLYTRAA